MASTEQPDPEAGAAKVLETAPEPPHPPPPASAGATAFMDSVGADVALRVLIFAATLSSLVVVVTSKQTELVLTPRSPVRVPVSAKFNHSPAFIYFLVALCVTCFYSIISTLASVSVILKPDFTKPFMFSLVLLDVVMLGVLASATGTAGGVAYVGLKGNKYSNWGKVCNVYDKFCRHIGSSLALSLFASILLLLLSYLSIFNLYKKIRD